MTKQQLVKQIFDKQTFLCVGLDPDLQKIPAHLLEDEDPIFAFNRAIIDATAPYCVAYKPNLAFFETYQVDALTIAPYMGEDSVKPFLAYQDKWAIVLALTSNKGSHDFQLTQDTTGMRLFEKVIATSSQWGTDENMMYVVGATQGKMFEDIRKVAPHHFLLVPGIGAQGGSLQEVCRYGMTKDCGLLVNSSRGILYASNDIHFAEAAKEAAKELQAQMKVELQAHC